MQITIEQYENIERYADGEMSEEEAAVFLKEVEENALLKEALELEQHIRNSPFLLSQHKDAHNRRTEMEQVGRKWMEENRKQIILSAPAAKIKSIRPLYITLAAAAVLVAIILFTVLLNDDKGDAPPIADIDTPGTKPTDTTGLSEIKPVDTARKSHAEPNLTQLFTRYYKKDKAPTEKPQFLTQALEDYEENEYGTIQNFEIPIIRGSGDEMQVINELSRYYKGLSYIETRNYKKAGIELQWVIDSATDKTIKAKAQWYRALMYVRAGNRTKAGNLLTEVAGVEKPVFRKQARDLLKDLGVEN